MTRAYHTIFNLLALSVVIYIGVDVFYKVVCASLRQIDTKAFVVQQHMPDDKGHQKPLLDDYRSIIGRNIFGSADRAAEEVEAVEIEALEPTSLKIALLGTVTGSLQNAFAVIEETDKKKQGLYRVGESIQDALIKMILRGKVILRVDNRDEILTMEEAAARRGKKKLWPSKSGGTGSTITVGHSEIKESLKDINKLLSQVRIRPHFRDGKPDGLAVSRIKQGSIFARLELKDGDIVNKINGKPINSPDDVLGLYEQLKSGSRVSIQINRKGQTKNIDYRFR